MEFVMLGLIALLIFFMFRNGRKRQQAMQELQAGLRPGAEVMLQGGIYGIVDSVDDEENRITVTSGTSSLVVHRSAVAQIVTAVEDPESGAELAPDDDPAFGERVDGASSTDASRDQKQDPAEAQEAGTAQDPGEQGTEGDQGAAGEAPDEDRKA